MTEMAIVSATVHMFLVAMVVLWWWPAVPLPASPPDITATLQVERVNRAPTQRGGRPVMTAKPNPAPAPPQPATTNAAPPTAPAPTGALTSAAPSPALPPAPTAQPSPPDAAVHLGDSDSDQDSLSDSGPIVSVGKDPRYRNMPPHYPADAARHRLGGIVALLVHVNADGTAGLIEVMKSSGVDSLDASAQEAVARWHFVPAEQNGVKVASLYPINIRFNAGGN